MGLLDAATAVDLLSGFASGVGVTVVGHPFETLKVRLQTQPEPPNHIYNGFTDCVRKTIQWEGVAGLYRGVASPLVMQLFFRSAMFWSNGAYVRWMMGPEKRPLSYVEYGGGGIVAWGACTAIECPLQNMSSQMQVGILRQKMDPAYVPEYPGVFAYAKGAPVKYGLRSMYNGVIPHLVRNSCGGFFHFGAFEYIRRETAKKKGVAVSDVGMGANLLGGAVGGVLFWTITYPADVVKSAMQGDALNEKERKYYGTVDTVKKLWKEGGAMRFTRGFSACLARSVPANAVLLTIAARVKEVGYEWAGVHKH